LIALGASARDPPRHVDEEPAARSRACGRRGGGPIGENGRLVTALGADARHEEREAGRDRPDLAQLPPCGRPDDEADRPARSPYGRSPGHPGVERLGREAGRFLLGDLESLQLARARVRRSAQDVGEAIRPGKERRDGLLAEVWADRDRVGAQAVEQGDRLAGGRRADVAALRVHHDRDLGRDLRAESLEGGDAGGAERLEEG